MNPIKFAFLEPAENPAGVGRSLNILVGMENTADSAVQCAVSVFGKTEDDWKCLCSRDAQFAAREHLHLYFRIPASCMSPGFWDADELEELVLTVGTEKPAAQEQGILVFCV